MIPGLDDILDCVDAYGSPDGNGCGGNPDDGTGFGIGVFREAGVSCYYNFGNGATSCQYGLNNYESPGGRGGNLAYDYVYTLITTNGAGSATLYFTAPNADLPLRTEFATYSDPTSNSVTFGTIPRGSSDGRTVWINAIPASTAVTQIL